MVGIMRAGEVTQYLATKIDNMEDRSGRPPFIYFDDAGIGNGGNYVTQLKLVLYPSIKFLEIDEITDIMSSSEIIAVRYQEGEWLSKLSKETTELMYKHHIDIHELIIRNLAYNKNDLPLQLL
jgi:hypothetical protein